MIKKIAFILFCHVSVFTLSSQTVLTHNSCDDIIKTINVSCSNTYIYFGRAFYLEEYGVSTNEEFSITSGQIGISYAEYSASVQFNIYEIDDNFPESFSETDLIGQSQEYDLPYIIHSTANTFNQIITVEFDNPVVIPAGVKRVLVEVKKGLIGSASGIIHVAGTKSDKDVSYYRGCPFGDSDTYLNSDDITGYSWGGRYLGENYNFYIQAIGNAQHISVPYSMSFSNQCSQINKAFNLTNTEDIISVLWNFGDPGSGASNISSDINTTHDFSNNGSYTVTATVNDKFGDSYVVSETVDILEPPDPHTIADLYACEDIIGTGLSSTFDTSQVETLLINGRTGLKVSYFDQDGTELPYPLPNPMSNTLIDTQTITARIAYEDVSCCYSEVNFNLVVNPLPETPALENIIECDAGNSGYTTFDLITTLGVIQSGYSVELYRANGDLIAAPYNEMDNVIPFSETITARIINPTTSCWSETTFELIVEPIPIANELDAITGCDDNNDGISDSFDLSNVETTVLGNQTGMDISYFTENGVPLPYPLPNPYTNAIPYEEQLTVRVTNPVTKCFDETILTLKTSTKPNITQPISRYTCDIGGGTGIFDLLDLEQEIIGTQAGLTIIYTNSAGTMLNNVQQIDYQSSTPWHETISIKVVDVSNPLCYSETTLQLLVNELPTVELEAQYLLCDLEYSLQIDIPTTFDNYEWTNENGQSISTSASAELIDAGNYTVTIGKLENNILCEQQYTFELVRSILPVIDDIAVTDMSNNRNSIEIIATGDGDFEYSIDGLNYQDSHLFDNLLGGIYTVYLRDRNGCGAATKEVTLIDAPKFFTPNNDGFNDTWHILGIQNFPEAKILIFNRFGKLLKTLSAFDQGWNGLFNGKQLPAADYWFTADLGGGRSFKGHFTLKR